MVPRSNAPVEPVKVGQKVNWNGNSNWRVTDFDSSTGDATLSNRGLKRLTDDGLVQLRTLNPDFTDQEPVVGHQYKLNRSSGAIEDWTYKGKDQATGLYNFVRDDAIQLKVNLNQLNQGTEEGQLALRESFF